MAAIQFATECLSNPTVAMTEKNDPQSKQIRIVLEKLRDGVLRILDFGAGQGRMIDNLNGQYADLSVKVSDRIDYVAIDEYPKHELTCRASISDAFGSSDDRYFSTGEKLLSVYGENSFDVIVMCNVLHEIPPEKWLTYFGPTGLFAKLLRTSGYLLIVEDQHIPVGEQAYEEGFLVLDTEQLKVLFGVTPEDNGFQVANSVLNGRLKAHLVPSKLLQNYDLSRIEPTVHSLRRQAREEIKGIRKKGNRFQNGQLHAFWVHQLANAELILENFRVGKAER
jgi:hypothetical protein